MKTVLRRLGFREYLGFAVAVGFLLGMVLIYSHQERARNLAGAQSALDNCRQIELIKGEIRDTVAASVARLPQIDYYQSHPNELRQALADAKASVARFHANDCYDLPVVKKASLERPRRRG